MFTFHSFETVSRTTSNSLCSRRKFQISVSLPFMYWVLRLQIFNTTLDIEVLGMELTAVLHVTGTLQAIYVLNWLRAFKITVTILIGTLVITHLVKHESIPQGKLSLIIFQKLWKYRHRVCKTSLAGIFFQADPCDTRKINL